jgi:hypothetical protein
MSGNVRGQLVSLFYQKGRDSRIFQAQDRAIDDFTLKGKPRNGIIDKFLIRSLCAVAWAPASPAL